PKLVVTVVVEDDKVDDVIQAIIAPNRTGKPGDGKIFVSEVEEVYTISSGVKEGAVEEAA
ncbi:MAG: P-II family nitrogen regulator, partial [Candidatus Electrothrix sp. AUS1_2]|nr:P-II family nitrogen regulator [Candidatus Electrothrix sp. AUS1_2]